MLSDGAADPRKPSVGGYWALLLDGAVDPRNPSVDGYWALLLELSINSVYSQSHRKLECTVINFLWVVHFGGITRRPDHGRVLPSKGCTT